MHIGMLTTGYPHAHDPVSGAFVRAMARALAQRGHAITVLCAERRGDVSIADPGMAIDVVTVRYLPRIAPHGTFHDEGAPARLRAGDPWALLGAGTFPFAALHAARRSLARCDALVSHFVVPCAPIAGLIRAGRPHHAIAHGTDARLFARSPAVVQRAVLAGCTSMQLTHEALRASVTPRVRDDARVEVAPMGWHVGEVSAQRVEACRRELLREGESHLVLSVARLVPEKGIDVLVRAAASLPPIARVVIAGDGPERSRVLRAAPANVTFLGAVDAHRRDELLRAADLCVVPSRAEDNAPVALLEAMGAGRAVMASRVPGLVELGGDCVRYARPGDARELASGIEELVTSGTVRQSLGAAAAARAARWHWDRCAKRIEARLARG